MLRCILATLASFMALALTAAPAQAQATRTWVSGVGDDVNPCSRTAPCKTFAGAISKTAAGGEINCLDPGGFGAVTITKTITISCKGTHGSTLGAMTNGVVVNGPGVVATLRDFALSGVGTGLSAIRVVNGTAIVDNVTIGGFNRGIDVAAGAKAYVTNSHISTSRGTAVYAGGSNAQIWVGHSAIVANAVALGVVEGGTITSLGGNTFAGNGSDGSFAATIATR